MKTLLSTLLTLTIVNVLFAAPKEYNFSGQVANSFTREPISDVSVSLMRPDSTVVATGQTRKAILDGSPRAFYSIRLNREMQGKFIVRFTHMNYDTLYANINVKLHERASSYNMDLTLLKRRMEKTLKEIAVTTTKVKMVVRGDTVVYNADAFQLSEGSMLDELIKQLPGAELKSDGRIYVNGRFVNSLLLNGKDFFKGNNRMLLDNLPFYMVNKVKVYEQSLDLGRFEGKDETPKLFVMDVNLKKEYSIGWIANAEAGYGSGDRFMGRLFGLRFTPNSRLTLFGNTNNINDTRRPGEDGEWKPSDALNGQQTSSIGGLDYWVEDKNRMYVYSNSTRVERLNTDMRLLSSGETFLPSGNMFSRSQSMSDNKDFKLSTQNSLQLTWKRLYWNNELSFDYSKRSNDVFNRSAVLSAPPAEGYTISQSLDSTFLSPDSYAVNCMFNYLKGNTNTSAGKFNSMVILRPWDGIPDNIQLTIDASYNTKDNNTYDHYGIDYLLQSPVKSDFRNRYTTTPDKKYNLSSKLGYGYKLPNGITLLPMYKYEQSYLSSNKSLYRFDRQNGWGADSHRPLGTLPSTYDSLQMAMDFQNSFYSTHRQYIHEGGLEIYGMKVIPRGKKYTKNGYLQVQASFPLRMERNRFEYRRNALDTMLNRSLVSFAPRVSLTSRQSGEDKHRTLTFNYSTIVAIPIMSYLLDVRDDANPLNVFQGNPNLKNTTNHSLGLGYSKFKKAYRKSFNINYNLNIIQNAVALGFLYDKQSGIRTTTPQNVDGNWYSNVQIGFNRAIDKKEIWSFSTTTYLGYNRNVDLTGVAVVSQVQRSVVDNINVKEDVSLRYQYKWLQASAKFGINAAHLTSERKDFNSIDYRDYNYGVNAIANLPWKMQFSTDLIQYSRRGYDEQSMNTDDLVWNLRLSKKVLKAKLTLMLDAFDVLGNLSNVNRSINAQGRTESYYNVVPRYVLLHAIYRLNIKPKKNNN